jgi:hypothetical protein
VRLDLATLVTEPPPSGLGVVDVNEHGDILAVSSGVGLDHYVFLREDSEAETRP